MKKSLNGFLEFDKAYLTFPNAAKGLKEEVIFFNPLSNYIEEKLNKIEIITQLLNSSSINCGDDYILYIDQIWHYPVKEYYTAIFNILQNNFYEKIVFYFHPKNKERNKHIIREIIHLLDMNDKIIFLEMSEHYKVELIAYIMKPKAVVSICSSALVYLGVIMPNLSRISIAPKLISILDFYQTNSKAINTIKPAFATLKMIEKSDTEQKQPIQYI